MDAYIEKPICLSIKSACLSRMIFFGENSLRQAVSNYLADRQSGEDAHRWSRRFGGVDVEQIIDDGERMR
jgi:hypothetical protein